MRDVGWRALRAAMMGLAALTGCAVPPGGGIPSVVVAGARPAPGPLFGALRVPKGPGLHPTVIVLHGCGGMSPNMQTWADRLADWGYGSLVLDSLSARGVGSVCAPGQQRLVTPADRAGDVVAAAQWLQTQPGVDGTRLAVIGLSHGGSTAATVTLHPFADRLGGMVKGAVNYYGNCREPGRYSGMPLLAMAGDADDWGPPAVTCASFGRAVKGDVTLVVYPGAVHSFENPALVNRRASEGHAQQYDPAAAADSFVKVRAFLARTIGPGG